MHLAGYAFDVRAHVFWLVGSVELLLKGRMKILGSAAVLCKESYANLKNMDRFIHFSCPLIDFLIRGSIVVKWNLPIKIVLYTGFLYSIQTLYAD